MKIGQYNLRRFVCLHQMKNKLKLIVQDFGGTTHMQFHLSDNVLIVNSVLTVMLTPHFYV